MNLTKRKFVAFFLFAILISSCPAETMPIDSEIFTSFEEGCDLKDTDIVLYHVRHPFDVEVWDSETHILKKRYEFKRKSDNPYFSHGYAEMDAVARKLIGGEIWFIGQCAQTNLVRFNIRTGEVKFVARNLGYYYDMKIFSKDEDGRGTVWVSQFMQPRWGGFVRCYDLDGNMLNKFEVRADDCDFDASTLEFKDGKYEALCMDGTLDGSFRTELDEQKGFVKLIFDIDKNEYKFEDIPYSTFFSKEFLSQFDYFSDNFGCLRYSIVNDNKNFYNFFLPIRYEIERKYVYFLYYFDGSSYNFLRTIDSGKEPDIAIYEIYGDNDKYTLVGYDKFGGNRYIHNYLFDTYQDNKLVKRLRVPSVNCRMLSKEKEGKIWYGFFDRINYSGPSKAYIYDLGTEKVYLVSPDGTTEDITQTCIVKLDNQ